jgi:pumilio family protein 6
VFAPEAFASAFLAQVPEGAIREMARGDGAFIVAELIERVRAEGARRIARAWSRYLGRLGRRFGRRWRVVSRAGGMYW